MGGALNIFIVSLSAPQQHPAQEISREEDNSHPQQPAEAATSITAAREAMSESAHQIIQDINLKRKQDTQLMLEFKEALKMQVRDETVLAISSNLLALWR